MNSRYIFILAFLPVLIFGQDKFSGHYKWLMCFSDTLENPPPNYLFQKSFKINPDFTYVYTESEDASPYEKPMQESIHGSWKYSGDTITFYNKNFKTPKGYIYNYYPDQKFEGIKLIVKDAKLNRLNIRWCALDSFGIAKKTSFMARPYRLPLKDEICVKDSVYTTIRFTPEGFCNQFRRCEFALKLGGIKSGTLIELIVYSTEMEIKFNNKRYILTKNILHEVSTTCYLPDSWTDNFIKTK